MDLKLSIIPAVIYACFVVYIFCEQNEAELVQKQIGSMKLNEELCKNVPGLIYSYDGREGKVVQNILTSYISDMFQIKHIRSQPELRNNLSPDS